MRKEKIPFLLFVMFLISLIFFSYLGIKQPEKREKRKEVSVIVEDSGNDRWLSMKAGMEQAAGEYNIRLNFVSTGILSGTEQKELCSREILEERAQGIILMPVTSQNMGEYLEKNISGIPLVLLESDVIPENTYSLVSSDTLAMGRVLAHVLEIQEIGKKVGILYSHTTRLAEQNCLEGVEEVLHNKDISVVWVEEVGQAELQGRIPILLKDHPVDVVITLGDMETEATADFVQMFPDENSPKIYGVGFSEKNVYYLDEGIIATMIVPNEFNMGYRAVEEIGKKFKDRLSDFEASRIDFMVIDKENMYEESNQRILFPIVQ